MKLTPALISNLFETPMADLTSLDMSNKEVSHIDDISACICLRKLNLAKNVIKSSDALSGLQYLPELTWLNLSNNSLENFEGLQKLKSLFGKFQRENLHCQVRVQFSKSSL
jgi:Leucine-rich repeat (LRR) protein